MEREAFQSMQRYQRLITVRPVQRKRLPIHIAEFVADSNILTIRGYLQDIRPTRKDSMGTRDQHYINDVTKSSIDRFTHLVLSSFSSGKLQTFSVLSSPVLISLSFSPS